ncbi:MAG: single-stranded-DNA-specific exonuclease RecJ [Casimicrobiaceae bacterium]|nr:single-stranded-DNA-specific exonuclease RecJ [Casimicrobiaceae bacterium]MDW8311804.1 single-stranded-DNA-specific exonuclease RecJ [Burkholderiales bacterium]
MNAPILVRRDVPEASVRALVAAGVDPLFARLYAARGVREPSEASFRLSQLPPPDLMKGMKAVVDRLVRAIRARERLLIIADYDADGATACAVGLRGLRAMGAEVGYLVPNRFVHGYGLTPEIVALAAEDRPRVLITVDNGIASVEGVEAARARGIDVIITDHHLPGEALPTTPYIVNPNQPGCAFPSKAMAGVGVMFYVLLALRAQLRAEGAWPAGGQPDLNALLDLVALGTVADVVPLDSLNRRLVEAGLRRIREGRMQPGVAALFQVAERRPENATTYDFGFILGPRINAAGRLEDMSLGIECLVTDDPARAAEIAERLDQLNQERRAIEADMRDEADRMIEAEIEPDQRAIVLMDSRWHQGVIGIVAGRLRERWHRPTLVFAPGEGTELKGSGRSIPGFHLRDALDLTAKRHPGLIQRFGGHAMAAGLSIVNAHFARFARAFEAVARELVTDAMLERTIESDGSFPVEALDFETARALHRHVWGQAFPPPLFDDEFTVLDCRVVAMRHMKMRLKRDGRIFEAIRFGTTEPPPNPMRAAYRVNLSEWQGSERVDLVIEQWWEA